MSTDLTAQLDNGADFDSLRDWLGDLPGVAVELVPRAPRAGEQGGGWDYLIITCGTGGAVTVAVNALKVWIESRVATVRLKIDGADVELRSTHLDEDMAHLIEVAKALRPDDS